MRLTNEENEMPIGEDHYTMDDWHSFFKWRGGDGANATEEEQIEFVRSLKEVADEAPPSLLSDRRHSGGLTEFWRN